MMEDKQMNFCNYINYRYYSVRFDYEKNTFSIFHEKYGKILDDCSMEIHLRDLNHVSLKVTLTDFKHIHCSHEKHLDSNCLAVNFNEGPDLLSFMSLRILLDNDTIKFVLDANKDLDYRYKFSGKICWGDASSIDTFAVSSNKKSKGIRSAYGPATSTYDNALFNRKNDSLLKFFDTKSPNIKYDWENMCYKFTVCMSENDMQFGICIKENVMTEKFALRYSCINKNNTFPTPPCGFMTWYAVMWNASEKSVLDNTEIMARQLQKYGANTVWVDWEWYHNDNGIGNERCDTFKPDPEKYPNGLKFVADKIKEYGLVPAIWIAATNDVSENSYYKKNSDILLLQKWSWCGQYFYDPTHPKFLNEFIPLVFNQILEWGYKAIKWDALPLSIDYYDQYHDRLYDSSVTSEQALRGAVREARLTIGDDIYMLSCHGEASRDITFSTDLFDAARVGADVFKWSEFLESCVSRVYKYYSLHNVVQYVDPDNVVIREEFNNMQQAISRVSFVSLLGMPVTFGDDLTKLSQERIDLLKHILPAMDIHPKDINSNELEKEYTFMNLYINLPYMEYQVVNIFNLTESQITIKLDFQELELAMDVEYIMFDFWNKKMKITRNIMQLELQSCESRVYAVHMKMNHPQLISTNRHITQGACEIKCMNWDEQKMTLSGSSEVIEGDHYILYYYLPDNYSPVDCSLIHEEGGFYSFTPKIEFDGLLNWSISFKKEDLT